MKFEIIAFVSTISTSGVVETKWYFNSKSSHHMTKLNNNLKDVKTSDGTVTFRDGEKGGIIRTGTLNVPRLPHFKGFLLVKGVRAYLISIS